MEQDLCAAANAAAALETQRVEEAHVAEAGAATPEAKYRAKALTSAITGKLPVDCAILPESRRATRIRRRHALEDGGAFGGSGDGHHLIALIASPRTDVG